MATAQTALTIPADATNDASSPLNRTKGFLGTASEAVEVMDRDIVAKYRAMSNEELIPIGEKALHDIADDIIALDEIRSRFRAGRAIKGYSSWKEFVSRNSAYSVRTIQRRLSDQNGKDESKINDRYKTPEPAPTTSKPVQQGRTKEMRAAEIEQEKAAGVYTNSFRAAQEANAQYHRDRKDSPNAELQYQLNRLLPALCDGAQHAFVRTVEEALEEDCDKQYTIDLFKQVIKAFEKHVESFEK
jgi:hypothetical protein